MLSGLGQRVLRRAAGAPRRDQDAQLVRDALDPAAIAGVGLVAAVAGGTLTAPSAWSLLGIVLGTLLAVAGLTAIPARIGARRPVAEILQSELA